jgi:hypothetical protein
VVRIQPFFGRDELERLNAAVQIIEHQAIQHLQLLLQHGSDKWFGVRDSGVN